MFLYDERVKRFELKTLLSSGRELMQGGNRGNIVEAAKDGVFCPSTRLLHSVWKFAHCLPFASYVFQRAKICKCPVYFRYNINEILCNYLWISHILLGAISHKVFANVRQSSQIIIFRLHYSCICRGHLTNFRLHVFLFNRIITQVMESVFLYVNSCLLSLVIGYHRKKTFP